MKNIKFQELVILSNREKAARRIVFDDNATILVGATSGGKSCVLKSLFYVFGASIGKIASWLQTDACIFLKFSIAGKSFYILRQRDSYSIFTNKFENIKTSTSVGKGVAPILYDLLDLKVRFINKRDNSFSLLSPGHIFSPFYLDQDMGWVDTLSSFSRLNYLKDYKKNLLEYYSGLKTPQNYEVELARLDAQQRLNGLAQELTATANILKEFNKKNAPATFNPDPKVFLKEIDTLLHECDVLLKLEQKAKAAISGIAGEISQIDIEVSAANQIRTDSGSAVTQALETDEKFECPLCGSHTDNYFEIAVQKAQDEKNYEELITLLTEKKQDLIIKQQRERENLSEMRNELKTINEILAIKKNKITLDDLINEAGRRKYYASLESDMIEIKTSIQTQENLIKQYTKTLRAINKAIDKKVILGRYKDLMTAYAIELDAQLTPAQLGKIDCSMAAKMGNENSRCVLAHFYAILTLSKEFSSAICAPIVIDTPFQQDPDEPRKLKIMRFLADRRPADSQLIMATSSTVGVDFKGKIIDMSDDDRYHLLRKEEYAEIEAFLVPFLQSHTDGLIHKG